MAHCDHCGNECTLPFTCQHCGGRYCPDCRLPPSHDCSGIAGWNARPRPAVGMSYRKGGGITATGGIAGEPRHRPYRSKGEGIPYLKIAVAVIVLILLGLVWLALTGH